MRSLGRLRCCLCQAQPRAASVRRVSSSAVLTSSSGSSSSDGPGSGRRRVVVTGTGVVSSLGVGTEHVWRRLVNGECGITRLEGDEFSSIPCRVAGAVPRGAGSGCLDLDSHVTRADRRQMSDAACFSLVAAEEALSQAGWVPETEEQHHYTGVAVGTGMASIEDMVAVGHSFAERGYSKVSPFMLTRILGNMPAGQISIKYGFKGPNHAVTTACTTGAHAVGDAFRFIKYGDAQVMVCGSTEASVVPLAIAAFSRIRALSTAHNDSPERASRPFDTDRSGFIMGEGAGILVLEELDHALRRGATILAEVLGYGLSADAGHITAPNPAGEGALRCMQAALREAQLHPAQLGYINAHATSTPLGDAAESRAISELLGADRGHVGVSSTKGAVGHLQGAAGSVEAIFTVLACGRGVMPPTLNCHNPDPEFDLNYVPLTAQDWKMQDGRRVALSNSFGFGGTNASLCIASWKES